MKAEENYYQKENAKFSHFKSSKTVTLIVVYLGTNFLSSHFWVKFYCCFFVVLLIKMIFSFFYYFSFCLFCFPFFFVLWFGFGDAICILEKNKFFLLSLSLSLSLFLSLSLSQHATNTFRKTSQAWSLSFFNVTVSAQCSLQYFHLISPISSLSLHNSFLFFCFSFFSRF